MSAYDRVCGRLLELGSTPGRTGGQDWRCPAHDDRTASLGVKQGDRCVVLKCQAGCSFETVLHALGFTAAELYDEPRQNGDHGGLGEIVDTYPYVDEGGELLFEVVRFEGKQFRQRRPDGVGGWIWKLGDTRRVLYRLPRVIAAVAESKPIFVVEGEKDVAAIERAGGVATCNPGGAGKWRPEHAEFLDGADVVVVVDQDPAGITHAADVEASLVGKARRVRVVDPMSGKDAFDHLVAGHTLEDWLTQRSPHELHRVLLGGLLRTGIPAPLMVHPWFYAGGLHTIQGEPGVGKSWLAQWLCIEVMTMGYAVLYLDEEGGEELVAERLLALDADPDMVDALFFYYPFPQRRWVAADVEALREALEAVEAPVGLGVLDSLPDFLAAAGMSEDSSTDVTEFIHRMLAPFREVGAALAVLDHLVKPQQGVAKRSKSKYARGSGAKLAKADVAILVEAPEEFDRENSGALHLWRTKDRRGYTGLPRMTQPPLVLDVKVAGKTVSISPKEGSDTDDGWDGPTRCMDAVLDLIEEAASEEFTATQLDVLLRAKGLGFRHAIVREAAERLALDGACGVRTGPRRSRLFRALSAVGSTKEAF